MRLGSLGIFSFWENDWNGREKHGRVRQKRKRYYFSAHRIKVYEWVIIMFLLAGLSCTRCPYDLILLWNVTPLIMRKTIYCIFIRANRWFLLDHCDEMIECSSITLMYWRRDVLQRWRKWICLISHSLAFMHINTNGFNLCNFIAA